MTAPPSPLFGLDASIYIFKAWFGREPRFYSQQGYALNAVEGFIQTLLKALSQFQPHYFFAAFDESLGQGFRERLYPAYKASRALPDEELAYQLDACKQVCEALGVFAWASTEFEADDLLATAAAQAQQRGQLVRILSRDKDLAQILKQPGDFLQDIGAQPKSLSQWQLENEIRCDQLPDYLALVGDAVDDIPGVRGIGPVAAKAILQRFDHLDAVFEDLPVLAELSCRGAAKLAEKLVAQRAEVFLFRELCRLREDVPFPKNWKHAEFDGADPQRFLAVGEQIGLPRSWLQQQIGAAAWVFQKRANGNVSRGTSAAGKNS